MDHLKLPGGSGRTTEEKRQTVYHCAICGGLHPWIAEESFLLRWGNCLPPNFDLEEHLAWFRYKGYQSVLSDGERLWAAVCPGCRKPVSVEHGNQVHEQHIRHYAVACHPLRL
jgi:hypothetical protein